MHAPSSLCAGVLVVLALTILLIVLVASCLYLYAKAGMFDIDQIMSGLGNATNGALDAVDQSDQAAYITFSVLATISLVIFIIFLIISRNSIWRCIAIVRETTKVFYSIPLLAIYPLIPVAFNIALVFYGVTIAAYIWTQVAYLLTYLLACLLTYLPSPRTSGHRTRVDGQR